LGPHDIRENPVGQEKVEHHDEHWSGQTHWHWAATPDVVVPAMETRLHLAPVHVGVVWHLFVQSITIPLPLEAGQLKVQVSPVCTH
jgi:hypothetical protein